MEGSFEEEWAAAYPRLRRVCRGATGDEALADDILQEVAIRAWHAYAGFRRDAAFASWVYAIAQREIARATAIRGRQGRREQPWDTELAEELSGDDVEPAIADDQWAADALAFATRTGAISPEEQAVVRARLAAPDGDWAEIGAILGQSANVCAVTHCRAIPKLRVVLFTDFPGALGGREAIARAFARVQASAGLLSNGEAEAFRRHVIEGRIDYRRPGWKLDLRGACGKVIREIVPES